MASPENKLLQTWFAPTFKAAGFTKSAATWHRSAQGFVQVFNIQGSQWSSTFYFNLGIYITALGKSDRPAEAHCHVRERLDAIVPDRQRLIQLSDFELRIPEEQRRSELQSVIESSAIPWLSRMGSLDQLRHFLLHEKEHGLLVDAATYAHLGITTY